MKVVISTTEEFSIVPAIKNGDCSYEGRNGLNWHGWEMGITGNSIKNNYWLRWSEWTHYQMEPHYSQAAEMKKHLSLNSPDRWLAVDMWGYYETNTSNYWMPHPGGVNILAVGGHVVFYNINLVELLAKPSWECPTYHVNRLLDNWGNATP